MFSAKQCSFRLSQKHASSDCIGNTNAFVERPEKPRGIWGKLHTPFSLETNGDAPCPDINPFASECASLRAQVGGTGHPSRAAMTSQDLRQHLHGIADNVADGRRPHLRIDPRYVSMSLCHRRIGRTEDPDRIRQHLSRIFAADCQRRSRVQ